jgi:hypothetical protein
MPETPDFEQIAHHIVDVAYTDDGQTARDVKAALEAGIAAQLRVVCRLVPGNVKRAGYFDLSFSPVGLPTLTRPTG